MGAPRQPVRPRGPLNVGAAIVGWAAISACGGQPSSAAQPAGAAVEDKLSAVERRLEALERELEKREQIQEPSDTATPEGSIGAIASTAARGRPPERRLVLRLRPDGLYHGDHQLAPGELAELIKTTVSLHDNPSATLLADQSVAHADVVETLDAIERAGIKQFSFATRPATIDDEPTSSSP